MSLLLLFGGSGGAAPEPEVTTTIGGGWLPREEVERFVREQEKLSKKRLKKWRREIEAEDDLVAELAAIYDRAMGIAVPEEAKAVAEVVKPFAAAKPFETVAPPPSSINWMALLRNAEAVRQLIEALQAIQIEDDDEDFLLMAASMQ